MTHAPPPRFEANAPPLLPHIGVTALVPDAWGGPWESRHQLLTRLARYVHVVWVDPVGWWREEWSGRRRRPPRQITHTRALPPGFQIFERSRLLPNFGRWPLDYGSEYLRLRLARLLMERRGARRHVLYLWRDRFLDALERGRYDLSCYHIDDDYHFSAEEKPVSATERAVITGVDAVFITSPGLMQKKGHLNPNTVRVPNGVDFVRYATPQPEPADMRGIPHPRIGYVGIIKGQLDVDILLAVARRTPDRSYVFVGPQRSLHGDADKWQALAALPNVYMLGEKHFNDLAAYVQHLDVCLLCYKQNGYTRYIYPLKLHEYFAAGRPVVGTPLLSFQEFREQIAFAESADQWVQQIDRALTADTPELAAGRRAIAQQHDWDALALKVARLLCENLGEREVALLERRLGEIGR